jgi:hypothetical protein
MMDFSFDPPATIERIHRLNIRALPSFVCPPNAHNWLDGRPHIHISAFAARPVEEGQWAIVDSVGGVHLLATLWEDGTANGPTEAGP